MQEMREWKKNEIAAIIQALTLRFGGKVEYVGAGEEYGENFSVSNDLDSSLILVTVTNDTTAADVDTYDMVYCSNRPGSIQVIDKLHVPAVHKKEEGQ